MLIGNKEDGGASETVPWGGKQLNLECDTLYKWPANKWHEKGEEEELVLLKGTCVIYQLTAVCDPALDADSKKPPMKRYFCNFWGNLDLN